jgi:hypothetical protein
MPKNARTVQGAAERRANSMVMLHLFARVAKRPCTKSSKSKSSAEKREMKKKRKSQTMGSQTEKKFDV